MSRSLHPFRPLLSSLTYHWRTHLAVVLSVMAGTAALTGALLVGDSMRGSLRDRALRRLGPVDHALVAPRFFREQLANEIETDRAFTAEFEQACPAILLDGGIHHAKTGSRVNRIHILGIDDRFRRLDTTGDIPSLSNEPRSIVLNRSLADELRASIGDDVLVRMGKHGRVPAESVLGRRDETSVSIRLTVSAIVPDDGIGGWNLKPDQDVPRNAFVPLATIQRTINQDERVNAILVTGESVVDGRRGEEAGSKLRALLSEHMQIEDCGLNLRLDVDRGYFALETDRMLIEPPVEAAAMHAPSWLDLSSTPVLTYLANTIALAHKQNAGSDEKQIPYSTITALASPPGNEKLGEDEILLNQWAADDLDAKPGDSVRIEYYVSRSSGSLETRTASFTLSGVVPMKGWAADPGFMPPYPGISDAQSVADWDPPDSFRIDLNRIRDKDEQYWKDHRGTPKAFVSLESGRRLWTEADRRFGQSTSIRIHPQPDQTIDAVAVQYKRALLAYLDPARLGLAFEPVRQRAVEAATGSTDFSQLFIAFSFFIIAAAAMLVALVFRLGVERRASEVGLLLALGYTPKKVSRLFILEGALLADIGSILGLLLSIGYAWLMLAGLRSADWWGNAVHAPFLELHISSSSLVIGYLAGLALATASIAGSIRGLTKQSPHRLMAGAIQSGRSLAARGRSRLSWVIFLATLSIAVGILAASQVTDAVPEVVAFFVAGTALLVAGLSAASIRLRRDRLAPIQSTGIGALVRLGLRNAMRHRARSLATAGLIACSTFVIVAVGASRHDIGTEALERNGGTGGYGLIAEAVIPLPYDPATPAGRDALNLTESTSLLLNQAEVMALRLQPGDDTSCLNLYRVSRPKILGAPPEMIDRGGFAFTRSMAESAEEAANPWRLLDRRFDDGAVPAIGDANTLTYLLKLGIGDDFPLTDERGRQMKLRIVGMLGGSVLQGELLIAERRFMELFPSISGHGFLLVDAPQGTRDELARTLERDLADFGLDVESTPDRLNAYRAVENTYMSTFQTLGGLGLVLGTLGLGAVMLRNVLERRGELALFRAVGFRRSQLAGMVLVENAALLLAGVLIGGLSALLAVAPNAMERAGRISWAALGSILIIVILVGMLAAVGAVVSALKQPLLPALRSE